MNPSQRSLRAQIGAHTRWANTPDRVAATAPARRAWHERWEKLADPQGEMSPTDRAKAAEHLMAAHMKRMALKSAQARARKKTANPQ